MEYICKVNRKNKGPGEGPVSPGRTPGLRSKYSSFELDNRLRAGKFVEWLCLSLYMYMYIYVYIYIYWHVCNCIVHTLFVSTLIAKLVYLI